MDVARNDRNMGGMLIAVALASMLAMAHHPTSAHATVMGEAVHGTLIALICVTAACLLYLSTRIGLARPAVLGACVAYGVALFANIGAATINGFIVTALVAQGHADQDMLRFAWESNQALARLAVTASGIAYLLWSVRLVAMGPRGRLLAGLGLLAGVAPVAMLAASLVRMNVAGAMLVYAIHALWAAAAGLYLMSGAAAREGAD